MRIFGPARVMASADLSSPRGRTQYPYALLKPWPRSGPPPMRSARMHANIGCPAARCARAVRILPLKGSGDLTMLTLQRPQWQQEMVLTHSYVSLTTKPLCHPTESACFHPHIDAHPHFHYRRANATHLCSKVGQPASSCTSMTTWMASSGLVRVRVRVRARARARTRVCVCVCVCVCSITAL